MQWSDLPSVDSFRPEGSPPFVFGHRGASADAPENTLAAFRLLAESGIQGVELDVQRCATGEVVVAHDGNLVRTSGRDLQIRDTALEELRSCDVGSWFDSRFADERIPLLSEVFELLGESVVYDIEIKSPGIMYRRGSAGTVEYSVARMIHDHGLEHRCFVSSFDPFVLRRFCRVAPTLRTSLITASSPGLPWLLRAERARLLCKSAIRKPDYRDVDDDYVTRAHAAGQQVVCWTVDDPETAQRLASIEVDGIISNTPQKIREACAG